MLAQHESSSSLPLGTNFRIPLNANAPEAHEQIAQRMRFCAPATRAWRSVVQAQRVQHLIGQLFDVTVHGIKPEFCMLGRLVG